MKKTPNSEHQSPELPSGEAKGGAWNLRFLWSLPVLRSAFDGGGEFGVWSFVPRGLALFLGGFALLNVLGEFRFTGFDANLWWIDLRSFPHALATTFLLLS